MDLMRELLGTIAGTARDVLPVALFMLLVHCVVLRQKLYRAPQVFVGLAFVTVGLALLLLGVDKALFPAGRMMVAQLSPAKVHEAATPHWWDFHLIYLFAFCITFAAAIAEPALLALTRCATASTKSDMYDGKVKTVWPYARSDGIIRIPFSPFFINAIPSSHPWMTAPVPRVNWKGAFEVSEASNS